MKLGPQKSFMAGLLACSILGNVSVAMAADVAATTTWQISRVASMSQGSYCTMTQKFADDTALTFARNGRNEYSLAIERSDAKFQEGKEQSVTLRPTGGAAQTYKAKNESAKATIVGIGSNNNLMTQLAKTGKLSIDIAKSPATYVLADFGQGQGDLDKCISALASSKEPTADLAKSAVTGAASSEAKVEKKVAKVEAQSDAAVAAEANITPELSVATPSIEGLLAAKPSPASGAQDLGSSEAVPVKMVAKEKVADIVASAPAQVDDTQLSNLRDENARLKRNLNEARKTFEDKQASNAGSAVDELKAKLDQASAENAKLQAQMNELQRKKDDTKPAQPSELAVKDSDKLQKAIDALKSENETLRNQVKLAEAKPSAKSVAPSDPTKVSVADDEKLRSDLREARAQLVTLQTANSSLQSNIEKIQKEGESSQLKVAGGNWDLEQATRRYQESQREIRRLGAQLDANTQKCQKEKKDIEYMLFDPEIAKKAQISMLNNLEDQVSEKDKKIKELQALADTPKVSPAQLKELADAKAQAQDLQNKLAAAQTDITNKQAAEAKKVADAQTAAEAQKTVTASLTDQLTKSNQKIAALEAQLAETQSKIDVATKAAALANDQVVKANQEAVKSAQEAKAKEAEAAKMSQLASAAGNELAKVRAAAVATPAVVPASAPVAAVTAPAQKPAAVEPVVESSPFLTAEKFSTMLSSAGESVVGGLKQVQGGDPNTYRAYTWKTENLYGNIEMHKVGAGSSVDDIAAKYLARAKSRCSGDFAAVPSIIPAGGKGYEIACVTGGVSSSASVVFTYANGIATTVAHEGKSDVMDLAIEARDKIAGVLTR